MVEFGRIAIAIYAVIIVAGGVIGYVKAHSLISMIAGVVSGLLLAGAFALTRSNPKAGFGMAAVVSVILIVSFWSRYQKTHNFMPSGLMLVLSVAAALLFGVTLLKSGS